MILRKYEHSAFCHIPVSHLVEYLYHLNLNPSWLKMAPMIHLSLNALATCKFF